MGSRPIVALALLACLAVSRVTAWVPPLPLAVTATTTTPGVVMMSLLTTTPVASVALALANEEIELTELPPPYVPALFGVALLIGVGVLTGSLGNVMDQEAQLGMQSGARARKEIERSRSSYFKKK